MVTPARQLVAVLLVAALLVVAAATTANADEAKHGAVEGEAGLAVVYSTSDLVSIGGFVGFSLGKPILDLFYVEPVLHADFSLLGSGRLAGLVRCNVMPSPGAVFSLGFGAGTGWKSMTDDNFNTYQVGRDFREVELALKLGGKRRFLIGVALAFDTNEMGEESTAVMLQTTLVRAAP